MTVIIHLSKHGFTRFTSWEVCVRWMNIMHVKCLWDWQSAGCSRVVSESVSVCFKIYCLIVMTLIAATYTVALRYTRTISSDLYFSTTAVCITEIIKLMLSLGMLVRWDLCSLSSHQTCCHGDGDGDGDVVSHRETGDVGRCKSALVHHIFRSPRELLKLSVPSVVYAIQNNMAFVALSNLDAAVYQVSESTEEHQPCSRRPSVLHKLALTLTKHTWSSSTRSLGWLDNERQVFWRRLELHFAEQGASGSRVEDLRVRVNMTIKQYINCTVMFVLKRHEFHTEPRPRESSVCLFWLMIGCLCWGAGQTDNCLCCVWLLC